MKKVQPADLITIAEAQKILDVSTPKMAKLVKDGQLPYWRDPLDARVKLVSRQEVEALKSTKVKAA